MITAIKSGHSAEGPSQTWTPDQEADRQTDARGKGSSVGGGWGEEGLWSNIRGADRRKMNDLNTP